ncbi:hypothetical protein Efla_004930 [Eimeria flavescens]
MLPYEGGRAAPEDAPTTRPHASLQSDLHDQELQGEESVERQDAGVSLHGSDDACADGERVDGRRRARASASPVSVRQDTLPLRKRKRTPSRRVVEAAESALLLEEVIANEAGNHSQESHTDGGLGAREHPCGGTFLHPQWQGSTNTDAAYSGDVGARVAVLREALQQHSGQYSLLEGGHGSVPLDSVHEFADNGETASRDGRRQRMPDGVQQSGGRRSADDGTHKIPLCRRPLFGAVEPRDLLGFGVPLSDVLQCKRESLKQQRQHQLPADGQQQQQQQQQQPQRQQQQQPQRQQQQQQQQQEQAQGEPAFVVDVVVVGAGVAGLAAASYLRRCGASVMVFEGRQRVGGRTFSSVLPQRDLPDGRKVDQVVIDLGASYMHCVTAKPKADEAVADCRWRREPSRSVSGIAAVLQPLVADVAGKQNWESTLFASWFDEALGRELPLFSVLKVHEVVDRLRERTAAKLLHLPPPLTAPGGPAPPAASLPNTIPAAEFLSPSLDQILLAAVHKQRSVKLCSASTRSSPIFDVGPDFNRRPAARSSITNAGGEDSEGSPSALLRRASPGASSPHLHASCGQEAGEDIPVALQHDTSDPCCCWASANVRERGVYPQRKGISACRFDHYYPLGNAFLRKVIKAFRGCPLCCTGSCGGAVRLVDSKHISIADGADGGEDSGCSKRQPLWGPPAPLVLSEEGGKKGETARTEGLSKVGCVSHPGMSHQAEASSDAGDVSTFCRAARREGGHDSEGPTDGNKGHNCDSVAALRASPRAGCKRQQSRRCSRTRSGLTCSGSNSGSGEPVLKSSRVKKSASATAAQAQTRLVPPLSLHDNRGVRRSAWDALEVSLCELLAEAEAEEAGLGSSGGSKEGGKDSRPHRPRKVSLLTPAEARMLLVVLQSRMGYVGDLRELPLSAVKNYPYEIAGVGSDLRRQLLTPARGAPPVPLVVPLASSAQRLRMQQAAMEVAFQQEQRAHVYPFCASAASTADKLVVDGWGWLPLFLSTQVTPFVVTDAIVQSIHVRKTEHRVRNSVAAANITRELQMPEDEGAESTEDEESEEDKLLAKSHPVRLRVEVNRGLQHRASHGLPQVAEHEGRPAHVWAHAKYCVVAVPLAQLALAPLPSSNLGVASADTASSKVKVPPTLGLIDFSPPLGADRCRALARYRMGCHNKVLIRWHPDDVFWGTNGLQLNCLDQKFQFLNLHAYGKAGCLLAHCFPPFSSGYGGLQTDQEVVAEVLGLLQQMFSIPDASFPRPIDFIVSRWEEDCFSRGSYSTPGVNAYDNDLDVMRAPHPPQDPRVLFCGEHLSKAYFQCVDGAFDTGLRAGEAVAHECLQLPLPPREDSRRFSLDFFCVPPCAATAESSQSKRAEESVVEKLTVPAKEDQEGAGATKDEQKPTISPGFLPQCPFSGFPLPPLPRVLRGHYLTDQSDLGLTDAEGGTWGEAGSGRRGPQDCETERRAQQVAAAEEYFLACCLSYIRTRSAHIFRRLDVGQQQHEDGDGDEVLEEFFFSGNASDLDTQGICKRSASHGVGAGDEECATGDVLPPLPPVPRLSELALSFQLRLETAAQRLFYRSFLSQYPLKQHSSVSADHEQQQQCGTALTSEEGPQNSRPGCQAECEDQQNLPFLVDFLEAVLMCTTSSSNKEICGMEPSEAALSLCQAFTRRMRRGGGCKVLDIEGFLLLLARSNRTIRESVLLPIRTLAQTLAKCSVQEEAIKTARGDAACTSLEPKSLERFARELMLPALPAHARNAKPPRMAAVAAGVLLMDTLERLWRAVPSLAAKETLQDRAAALDALVLKSLANSQFVSAIGGGDSSQSITGREAESSGPLEPLHHEQLCWLCRGEGDLLLCDGLPATSSTAPLAGEVASTSSSGNHCGTASRPCCHVFHMGCAFPPPTPAELQPNARWSCPLCKADAFKLRYGMQSQRGELEQRESTQDRDQHRLCHDQSERQRRCERDESPQLEATRQQQNKDKTFKDAVATPGPGDANGQIMHQVVTSLEELARQEAGQRVAVQLQLHLASCEELQLAALKRLFVDKARGLLARTRQLCKRLDFLRSRRRRLHAAARRRRWRLRSRAHPSDSRESQDTSDVHEVKKHSHPSQHQPPLKTGAAALSSPARDYTGVVESGTASRSIGASCATRRRCTPAAQAHTADGNQPDVEDEQPSRRTRRSAAVGSGGYIATGVAGASSVESGLADVKDAAEPAAGDLLAGNGRAEGGKGGSSGSSEEEDCSEPESEPRLDQFAAAAQTPKFATALRLLAQVREMDGTTLPLKVSALQHWQHVTKGCICNLHRGSSTAGTQLETATQEVVHEGGSNREEFCYCAALTVAGVTGCLCVLSARHAAAAALRSLLEFRGKKQMVCPPQKASSRWLVPQLCFSDAEVEALSRNNPSWLSHLMRPARRRRPLQSRMISRNTSHSEASQHQEQQRVLLAGQLKQLQQQQKQVYLTHSAQKLMHQLRVIEGVLRGGLLASPVAQPRLPVHAQRQPNVTPLLPPIAAEGDPMSTFWRLLQGTQWQQQQTPPGAVRAGDIASQRLQLAQLQRQLLLQLQRSTAALQASQMGRVHSASAAGTLGSFLVEAEGATERAQQVAPMGCEQSSSHRDRVAEQVQLLRGHSQSLHRWQTSDLHAGVSQQEQHASASRHPGIGNLQQRQRHLDELLGGLQKTQREVEQQQLRQRVLRLQQLQRQLMQFQQHQDSASHQY